MPSIQLRLLKFCRHGLERPVEVVRDRQELAQQVFAGEAQFSLAILGGSAPVVGEVRGGPLQAREMLRGLCLGVVELGPEPLHLVGSLSVGDIAADGFGVGRVGPATAFQGGPSTGRPRNRWTVRHTDAPQARS